ncbi:MAG TPA: antitoxin Xre/MbcA/ParS toxin-binding domain-containing protein [Azospirillaceae bacterium]|nr:antitoxin Xre/MbcA/ParS toxin-binding domain-containing protein [Azospirillaceae bacterium]
MPKLTERDVKSPETGGLERVAELLGGSRILKHPLHDWLDAHEMILRGLPGSALEHLVEGLTVLKPNTSLEKAMGISLRTYQRRRNLPTKALDQEQSGRTWKFAEILARATEVLGSQEAAEQWLDQPAIGLNQRRPIDLLATPAGVEIVEDFLTRLEFGVYA